MSLNHHYSETNPHKFYRLNHYIINHNINKIVINLKQNLFKLNKNLQ